MLHPSKLGFFTFVALVSAQDPLQNVPLSDGCKAAFLALRTSPVSACLNIDGFLNIISTSPRVSWVDPVSAWVTKGCDSPDCSKAELTAAVTSVKSACWNDLQLLRFTENTINDIERLTTKYYKTAKNILCLRNRSNHDSLCVRDQLVIAESVFQAPLNPTNILNNFPAVIERHQGWYPTELVCSKCNQAAYHIVKAESPEESVSHGIFETLTYQCDPIFKSQKPTDVTPVVGVAAVEAANSTAGSSTSGSATNSAIANNSYPSSTLLSMLLVLGSLVIFQ